MNFHFAKCPYCKAVVSKVLLEQIEVGTGPLGMDRQYNGVSYSCSSCHAILSVSIDPISLKHDVIEGVVEKLRKG